MGSLLSTAQPPGLINGRCYMWQHKLWNMRQFTRTEIYKRYIVPSPVMMRVHRVTTLAATKGIRTLRSGNRSLDSVLPCAVHYRPTQYNYCDIPASYRYCCTIIHVGRILGASIANCGSRAPLSSASTNSYRLPPRALHHKQLLECIESLWCDILRCRHYKNINPTAQMPKHGSQPEGISHLQGRK